MILGWPAAPVSGAAETGMKIGRDLTEVFLSRVGRWNKMGKRSLRRLSVLVAPQTMYNLERLARMDGRPDLGQVINKLTREKMLFLRASRRPQSVFVDLEVLQARLRARDDLVDQLESRVYELTLEINRLRGWTGTCSECRCWGKGLDPETGGEDWLCGNRESPRYGSATGGGEGCGYCKSDPA